MRPRRILFATWLVVLLYAFPGYMNWDSAYQLLQVRHGRYNDLFPPFMAFSWALIERVVRGPAGMLLLQTALFVWGLYGILVTRWAPRTAAIATAVLCLFPPILTPMAVVWKDAQMAAYLVAGLALALQPRRWQRGVGVLLLVFGAAMRYNAAAALPPLCLLVCGAWGFRRRLVAFGPAIALCLGIVGAVHLLSEVLTARHTHPWSRTTAVWDLAGTICRAGPMSDAELTELLAGTGHIEVQGIQAKLCAVYTTRFYLDVTQGDAHYFTDPPTDSEVEARGRAWRRAVREHPGAYLAHRAAVMAQVLGLTDDPVWEPVCLTVNPNEAHRAELHHDFQPSGIQWALGKVFVALGGTPLYRAWIYAALSLVFFGYALVRRDRLLLALIGSGLLYEAGFFVGTPSVDYRYSHWMVTLACIAGVIIFVERYTAAQAALRRAQALAAAVV